jgi:hypothetical protein
MQMYADEYPRFGEKENYTYNPQAMPDHTRTSADSSTLLVPLDLADQLMRCHLSLNCAQ